MGRRSDREPLPVRDAPPGREVRPAYSRRRRIWYGYGTTTTVEKSRFGCLLSDVARLFADVSFFGLPALLVVMLTGLDGPITANEAALVAWLTMIALGTLFRGGWVRPPGTAVRGWVSITPSLVALRIGYYNLVLLAAAYGGLALATPLGWPVRATAIGFAIVATGAATAAFPRLAESYCRRVG